MLLLVSLPTIVKNDWRFKASVVNGTILIVAYNILFCYTAVKYFEDEVEAKEWVEYLANQGHNGEWDETKTRGTDIS